MKAFQKLLFLYSGQIGIVNFFYYLELVKGYSDLHQPSLYLYLKNKTKLYFS